MSWRGMFVTGVQRYVRSLWDALQELDTGIEFTMRERKYWETHIFGKPVGGYASLLVSHFLDKRADDDKILHAVAPMPLQKCDIITVHDLCPWKDLQIHQSSIRMGVGWLFCLQSILEAKKIITPTEHVRQDVIRMCGKKPENVYAIHEGVDTNLFRPLKLRRDMSTVLYVGDDNPRKNVDNLIRACSRLGFDIVWVGPCHHKHVRQRVIALADELDVKLTEIRNASDEELVRWYNECAIHALVSFDEGFGLPNLEAAATGTLSVMSDILPFREIMRDNGMFVNPNDVESITKGLKDALFLSKSLNGKWLRWWASRYSWEETARKTLEVYRRFGEE